MDLHRVLTEGEDGLDGEELLVYHLIKAQNHAQQALDILYRDIKRSVWYRMVLGRAQNILISLVVREVGKREE